MTELPLNSGACSWDSVRAYVWPISIFCSFKVSSVCTRHYFLHNHSSTIWRPPISSLSHDHAFTNSYYLYCQSWHEHGRDEIWQSQPSLMMSKRGKIRRKKNMLHLRKRRRRKKIIRRRRPSPKHQKLRKRPMLQRRKRRRRGKERKGSQFL